MPPTTIEHISNFDISNLAYSKLNINKFGGKAIYLNNKEPYTKLVLQLPKLQTEYGLNTYTHPVSKVVTYSLNVTLNDSPECYRLRDKLDAIDDEVIKKVVADSRVLLGDEYTYSEIKKMFFTPLVRPGKDGAHPTMKLKVSTNYATGNILSKVFNQDKSESSWDSVTNNKHITVLADFASIYFVDRKVGVSCRCDSVLLHDDLPAEQSFSFI
jgi:hypothetical protein